MDPVLLRRVIEELDGRLRGAVISKIHQMDERNVVLRLFSRGKDERLLISTHPLFSRLHLTSESFVNPPAPLRFCAFLRSRIEGARVEGFTQREGERIAEITVRKRKDSGEETLKLIAELTGKSANIILTDEWGIVLDSLKQFPETSVRAVMPGIRLSPLPPLPPPPPLPQRVVERVEALPERLDGESWNEAAARHYSGLLKAEEEGLRKSALKRAVNEARKKTVRLLSNLEGDRERASEGIKYQKFGELIITNLDKIKRGDASVLLDDFTVTPPSKVTVPLDERLSPRENAEKCFRRSKKAKAAIALLEGRVPRVREELSYMDSLSFELDSAETPEDLDEVEDELKEAGYIKAPPRPSIVKEKGGRGAGGEKGAGEPIKRLTSSDGFAMLLGKSGKGNDLIVKKYAKDEDIWLHAANVPGAHVLVKTAGRAKELTMKTIEEAASLAAFNSGSRDSSKAEVIYTEARNVKKPRGAKPGMVTVREYKTILVRPGNP